MLTDFWMAGKDADGNSLVGKQVYVNPVHVASVKAGEYIEDEDGTPMPTCVIMMGCGIFYRVYGQADNVAQRIGRYA